MVNTEKIKLKMKENGVTQSDLACLLGVARPTVSQKINQQRPISLKEAQKIVEYFDIPLSEFGDYFFCQ